jgi:hypothetical protein
MNTASQPVLLIIDNCLLDIALFETAWKQAGHDEEISIFVCFSCQEAMTWLCDEIPGNYMISGVLVDLMLSDEGGKAAIDSLNDMPMLKNVPLVSWVEVDKRQGQTDQIRKSDTPVWNKPSDWQAWSDFTRRIRNVLDSRSPGFNPAIPTA